ncbi:prepilin-type N-terminal cleavage/methylation domain-containing protein [Alkalibacter rhizosphaerae]|uniref:Prepilin-type N-terminal cleavage/methylation domain-containing protein n=1 Tax=Alkalibacter rhizosphaerae TaxID=2815577 RepID=A0A975AI29_9FIRM|nr:prepilin-type N-terminal cleavage/methylation domain-containing protein [Alkalibacter rhizosphaerae]QSX08648.1 prepilin-type N-terminal cleavage/methylation domain-containing protein [Alkalibacter rhizosphaerae]
MKKAKGYSLIELLIGMLLLSLAWSMAMGILGNQLKTVRALTNRMDVETNVRHTMILLERQLEQSDRIIVENGTMYLRDLENPVYLNYYSLEGIYLHKNKVYENLRSIGLGSKSQMAYPITSFQMEAQEDGTVLLTVESTFEEQVYRLTKVVTPASPVVTLE